MANEKMKAVILAAGVGSRIRPLTNDKPKSLLKIGRQTILSLMLENIRKQKIKNVAIVTGYLEDQIKKFVAKNFKDLDIEFIKNKHYRETNTGYSLMLAKDFVGRGSFVKFDADVVFESEILKKLLSSPYENCLAIDRNINLEAEEVKVVINSKNRVRKIGKKLDPKICRGESIGIEKIGREAATALFNNLSSLMSNSKNFNQYYDDQYGIISSKGIPFYAIDITGLKWVEIDTHEDYEKAQRLFVS